MTRAFAILVCLVVALSVVTPRLVAASHDFSELDLQSAVENRAALGLRADRPYVAQLLSTDSNVGLDLWGIPMTAGEEAAIDLPARMAFADRVDQSVIPFLRSKDGYAGAYIDQAGGGRLIVRMTHGAAGLNSRLAELLGPDSLGFDVRSADHSSDELDRAMSLAPDVWRELGLNFDFVGIGLDFEMNGIVVKVEASNATAAEGVRGDLEDRLGVRILIQESDLDRDTHCTLDRDHCHGPMAAGISIYEDVVDGHPIDGTMGFHIRIGTNEHFVTAGHIDYCCGSNVYIHPPVGNVGSRIGTLYVPNGQDIMYVAMADAQASDNIFDCCGDVIGIGSPIQNETLCISLGESDAVKCAIVTNPDLWYVSNTPDPDWIVRGADLATATIPGDSGSPVYRPIAGGTGDSARAIGVNTTEFASFAKLSTSLDDWAAVVVN